MKMTINKDGSMHVAEEIESTNDKGDTVAGERSWSVPPDQVAQHVRAIDEQFSKLSPGDKAAARDHAHELAKQRKS